MMGHKICFSGEIWLIIPKLSLFPLLIWNTGCGGLRDCFGRENPIFFLPKQSQRSTCILVDASRSSKLLWNRKPLFIAELHKTDLYINLLYFGRINMCLLSK